MTPEQMAACAEQGRFWWMRPDGTFYGTPEHQPQDPEDMYLLDASPGWVSQWQSWEVAAETMAPLFARLDELVGGES